MAHDDAGERPARPLWAVALGVGVVLVVVVAVSGALGRVDRTPREVWRLPFGEGQVMVTERYAVHGTGGTVSAIDLTNGDVVWRTAVSDGEASLAYADEEVVAVTPTVADRDRTRLAVLDTTSGDTLFDRVYATWTGIDEVHHVGGILVLGVTVGDGPARPQRVHLDLAGEEVDRRGDAGLVVRWRNVLLESTPGVIEGVRDVDAVRGERWLLEGAWTDLDLTAGRVLVRAPAGDYEVRALDSGDRLWSISEDGVLQAQFIGSWVGLTFADGMEVIDPADGTARLVRRGVAPTARVPSLALERFTVVAWPDSDGVELAAYDAEGDQVVARGMASADGAAAWVTLAPVAGHPGLVQVIADAGRDSTWLALPAGEIVRDAVDAGQGHWDRDFADGLLWRSRSDELVLEGPEGSVTVAGATRVVSVDPLLVHGPAGLIRLDPRPVLGPGAG